MHQTEVSIVSSPSYSVSASSFVDDDPERKNGKPSSSLSSMNHYFSSVVPAAHRQHVVPVLVLILCLTVFSTVVPLSQPRVYSDARRWAKSIVALNTTLAHIQDTVPVLVVNLKNLQQKQAASQRNGDKEAAAATTVTDLRIRLQNQVAKLVSDRDDILKPPAPPPAPNLGRVGGNVGGDFNPNESPGEPVNLKPGGPYVPPPDIATHSMKPSDKLRYQREFVRDAFKHSWKGYKDYAWGTDELQPRSRNGKNWNDENPYISLSLSIMDALTTMHFMGLETELKEAMQHVRSMSFAKQTSVSTFEMMIRVVGSLLSLYELRGEQEPFLLKQAVDIANRLMFAFNTTSGLPHQNVHLMSHHHASPDWAGGASVLSEFGTVQLELRTLSFHTKDPSYDMRATHIMDIIDARAPFDGMCPVFMSIGAAQWLTDHITLGALGDSFYEYVLKQYLLTGKTEQRYKKLFRKIANAVVDKLVFKTAVSGWAYMAEWRRNEFYHKQDHLACFFGGSLALAANKLLDPENSEEERQERDRWMKVAAELTETCYEMYHQQKSGVSPEYVEFMATGGDFINGNGYYILRPETMEALFYMWRFTKEQRWRDMGWNIFQAVNRWCRVETGGFAGLQEVNVARPVKDNLQQSFWLAETLKYSYLLFCEDDAVNLDEWVFNTEAHPLKIRKRDPLDVWRAYEESHGGSAASLPWWPPRVLGVNHPTETERMKKRRVEQNYFRMSGRDVYSEEIESGAVDDDGLPFDPHRGPKGIPRGVPKRRRATWFGPQSANQIYDQDVHGGKRKDQQQENDDDMAKMYGQQAQVLRGGGGDSPPPPGDNNYAYYAELARNQQNAIQQNPQQAYQQQLREADKKRMEAEREDQVREEERKQLQQQQQDNYVPATPKKSSFAAKYRGAFRVAAKPKQD